MPITHKWMNPEKSILMVKFAGKWDMREYYANVAELTRLVGTQEHGVVTIGDLTENAGVPPQFLNSGFHSQKLIQPNNLGVILFGLNMYMETIVRIYCTVFSKSAETMMTVKTHDEAIHTAEKIIKLKQSGV